MNETIKELAEQAGYTPLPGFDFANSLEEVFLQKFAELIVRECMSLCDDYNSQKYIANRFGLTPLKLSEMENKNV